MARRRGEGLDPAHVREFEEFFLRHQRGTVRAVVPLVRDLGEAEDIAMIAYERAARDWSTVRTYEDPAGWVRRVAWNEAVSWLRRARRQTVDYMPDPPQSTLAHTDTYEHETPELLLALRRLSHRDRVVLTLHYIWGLTVDEAARHLDVSPNTLKAQLARARQRLAAAVRVPDGQPAPGLERSNP